MMAALKSTKARSFCMLLVAVLLVRALLIYKEGGRHGGMKHMILSEGNTTWITIRKLLEYAEDGNMNRIGTECSKDDIVIYEGEVGPLPSGIPAYRVQITNMCATDCNIANIRLHCGWFSSARLINPTVFRRLQYDDCLVNDGQPLSPGKTISFDYANSFRYPLSVSSLVCLSP
ncbi:hypothetical protein VNO77_06008 [Canavalia gladiata]|uniref:Uncharacterized protein n=1 Tax=Canavalia gladiata TaxID=3824 RepID=A0AAN9N532_CANGL